MARNRASAQVDHEGQREAQVPAQHQVNTVPCERGLLCTVLELVLILRDEGDADALVSRLLQNHKPEERHRLLLADRDARGRAVDGPQFLISGRFWARG